MINSLIKLAIELAQRRTFKVLPLRLESAVVDKLDEAWRSRGIKSRTEFFRGAIGRYLKQLAGCQHRDLVG
jgi:metal-responsive CopG/Arc/MetJ family transcriptional regulator